MVNFVSRVIKHIIKIIAIILSAFYTPKVKYFIYTLYRFFYTNLYARHFNTFGPNSLLGLDMKFKNLKYVRLGGNSTFGDRTVLTCYKENITPSLVIGNNVSIGDDAHITCSNNIIIENNVLIGKKVTISDNAHGTIQDVHIIPKDRHIVSKGPILIKENVWIGDKVTILSGVTIGKGAIIGANTVVTKDVSDFSVVVGQPARTI